MDLITDDDEIVKLLDVKDIEIIEPHELIENDRNTENVKQTEDINKHPENMHSNPSDLNHKNNGFIEPCTERRSDEPTELSFEKGDDIIS